MPCSAETPFPIPSFSNTSDRAFDRREAGHDAQSWPNSRCEASTGQKCRWHHLSRMDYYRPNCSLGIRCRWPQADPTSTVFSLAKGSDVSPTFYAGLSGAIAEINLHCGEKNAGDPTLALSRAELPINVSRYGAIKLRATMVETGIGFAQATGRRSNRIPMLRSQSQPHPIRPSNFPPHLARRHRLDARFQTPEDFPISPTTQQERLSEY